MAIDELPGALPRLVGAPAYARPKPVVETAPRPFDPDELPLEVDQTEEERAFAAGLPARAYAPGGAGLRTADATARASEPAGADRDRPELRPRPLRLRAITRLLGGP